MHQGKSAAIIAGVLLFVLALVNCLWWSASIEYNGAPDEYEHIKTRRFIAEHGRLPRSDDPGFGIHLLDSNTKQPLYPLLDAHSGAMLFPTHARIDLKHRYEVRQPYIWTPQLAHLLAGRAMRLSGMQGLSATRAFNALCVAAAALLCFVAGMIAGQGRLVPALAAGAGLALWPQLTFIGAYANDDAFAVFSVAALLAVCCSIELRGLNYCRALLLGLCMGLALLSKLYVYALFPLLGLWLLLRLRAQGRNAVGPGILALVAAALCSGWWFVRNAVLLQGSVLGRDVLYQQIKRFSQALPPELAQRTHLLYADSFSRLGQSWSEFPLLRWLKITFASCYGMFGWMDRILPPALYWIAFAALLLGLATAAAAAVRRGETRLRLPSALWLLGLPYMLLLLLLSLYNSYYVDMQPQGRYLLSSLPALLLLAGFGAASLHGRLGRIAPLALCALYLAFNLLCRLQYV
ncbi:MAG: DUF2142 domain-containing protein [Candidatus Alcyoniella australis]|nr:DUF2142 domain-containing protein [Candidatus Alcyoniella australis]